VRTSVEGLLTRARVREEGATVPRTTTPSIIKAKGTSRRIEPHDRVLTFAEAAEYLSLSKRQVKRLCDERKIAFIEYPLGRRILESDALAWLAARRVEAVVGRRRR
jgi:excisionase family DNA binding protein